MLTRPQLEWLVSRACRAGWWGVWAGVFGCVRACVARPFAWPRGHEWRASQLQVTVPPILILLMLSHAEFTVPGREASACVAAGVLV